MTALAPSSCLPLPAPLVRSLDAVSDALLQPQDGRRFDFTQPAGEAALAAPDSISWILFKNPVALFIGGVAAVILELAEPAVRTGVWEHSSFRADPVRRLQRTGLAAMVTVYGARSVAEAMIAHVVTMHGHVAGKTPDGAPYHANDTALLDWVQATASFGFAEAYSGYVRRLDLAQFDQLYAEAQPAARLYGAVTAPGSRAEMAALFDRMSARLEPSPVIFEFLNIMRQAPAFPAPLRWLQRILVRAAVDLIPATLRARLGLAPSLGLRFWQRPIVRLAGSLADRVLLPSNPAVQSCRRLWLPPDYLFRGESGP